MRCCLRKSLRPSCRCSSDSQDVVIQPCIGRKRSKPAIPIRGNTQGSSEEAAPQPTSTGTHGAEPPLIPVQRRYVAREYQPNGPGYAVVPHRGDIPPAVNEPLPLKKTKSPQHITRGTRDPKSRSASRGTSNTFQRKQQAHHDTQATKEATARPSQPPQHATLQRHKQLQHTYQRSAGNLQDAEPQQRAVTGPSQPRHGQQQAQHHQPHHNNKQKLFGRSNRGRYSDPGKAFMRAGMPSGLWVLPVDARSEAPPAPPPAAPEDPTQLLQVLQNMPPPRRKLVIFKGGGYIFSDMEALIEESELSHVMRLTNLIRKANCVLAKPVWDNGRRINLRQHQAAAEKARVPFLLISQLDPLELVAAVRPLLIKRKALVEQQQQQQGQHQQQQ